MSAKDTVMVFVLPAPPRDCSPNLGKGISRHWRTGQKARKSYLEQCHYAIKEQTKLTPRLPLVELSIEWHKGKRGDGCYQPLDEDNARASLKAAQDSLVAAGILMGDSAKHITRTSFEFRRTEGSSYITYTIRVREAQAAMQRGGGGK